MPEGDTIYRTAARLRPVLQGQTVTAARARDAGLAAETLVQRTVQSVEARGKHLLIHLENGLAIHSHLGMHGAWHVYVRSEAWQKPERLAALTIEVPEVVCVCFNPKTLELLTAAQLQRHPHISRLGPDLLADAFDEAEVLRRFRVHNAAPIGEAVMNQTIVCGIGNVYKSEVLFLTHVDPFCRVADLSDDRIVQIVRTAREWLSRNLSGSPRRTRFGLDGQRLWVYGRNGKPCFVCGERIQLRRQGDLGRTTTWCPRCQRGG
jgi:endonuclease-8